jgi:hypothetical protein
MKNTIGQVLLLAALFVFGVGVGQAIWFWFGTLVPWFWQHEGNLWPALLPLAIVSFAVGAAMIGTKEETE